jgi:hypothetical protein
MGFGHIPACSVGGKWQIRARYSAMSFTAKSWDDAEVGGIFIPNGTGVSRWVSSRLIRVS